MLNHDIPPPLQEQLEQAGSASLREISDLLPMWLWETDANYVITYCSKNIGKLMAVAADELVGICILESFQGGGETEAGLAEYQDLLRQRRPIESYSYERMLLSGETVVLLDSAIPRFDPEGRFTGYCGVSFHLSDALRAADDNGSLMVALKNRADQLERALSERNAELAASNRLLGEVLDALGEGLLVTSLTEITDPQNTVMFVNPAYCKLVGLEPDMVYSGMSMSELPKLIDMVDPDSVSELPDIAQKIQSGEVFELRVPSNGIALQIKGIPRPGGGLVIVHTDVTELRTQIAMQEEATYQAEAANTAKSSFLASISHEIRTPMNGVVGVADLLHETQLDPEQLEYVETIRSSAVALTNLITEILDYSKIEAGHLTLQEVEFDLLGLMEDMRKMLEPLAHDKGIVLAFDHITDQQRHMIGDQKRLRQIMINLVGNGIKFTQKGRVAVSVGQGLQDETVIKVQDTGIGIPTENLSGIFNSFEQVQSGFHREFEGTGLGLAISQKLVWEMGGDISVTSQEGQGSEFIVTIPLRRGNQSPDALVAPVNDAPRALDLSKLRILVAEDNRTNQLVAKKMLNRCGVVPDIVENGQEACTAFRKGHYDLVLMDVSMPVMSGLEATRDIRQFERDKGRPACPIVALTGNAFASDRENCIASGMTDFITKPIRLHELFTCIEDALELNTGPIARPN